MAPRRTRNVSLTPQLDGLIDRLIARGGYRSSSEVVRAALRLLEAREASADAPADTPPAETEEAGFGLLAESLPAMLWMGDSSGRPIYMNLSLRAFWGVGPEEMVGFDWIGRLHPEDAARVAACFRQGRQTRTGFTVEARYRNAAGEWRLLRTEAEPRFAPDGTFFGLVGTNLDVTELRRTEQALRESEAQLRDLVATLDLSTLLVRELDGTIRFWAAGCQRLYGWAAEEAVGQPAHRLLQTEFPLPQAEIDSLLLRDGAWKGDLRQRRRDGSEVVVSVQMGLRRDAAGRPVAIAESLTDVTVLRRTEAGLSASEQRLRMAQEAAEIGIFDWDVQRRATSWSPEMFRLMAIDPATPPEACFDAWLDRVHPADRARAKAETVGFLARPGPLQIEYRLKLPDGSVRWMLGRGVVETDEAGRPRRMLGVNLDVTSLRRAEAKARQSEARQRALFHAAPFAVIVIDQATLDILEVNDRACADYGYTRAEFLRMNIGDIDILGNTPAIRERGRRSAVGPRTQEFEARHRLRNGQIRDVLVRVHGVDLDGRRVTYGAHFDITDRKAAEAALRGSDVRLRLALEAAEFGSWEYDIARDLGWRRGLLQDDFPQLAVDGFPLSAWVEPIHPAEREMVEGRLRAVCEGRSPRFEAEFRVPAPEGGWRWIASRGAVVETGPEGRPSMLAGVARDITESRQAAERQALLAREVDHRAKNALAVVLAALRLTKAPDLPSYTAAIEGRVSALARAQTLLADRQWEGAELETLLRGEVLPFLGGQRVSMQGPCVTLSPVVAQALAMTVHELATNAVKHGALSAADGEVRLEWCWSGGEPGRVLLLHWTETGGPPLAEPPLRRGFGSRVLEATVRSQLSGQITLDWRPEGLACRLELPLGRRR
ncbi:type II toxin-antitoxin system ParD family antitoxin [Falsiroseomonas tokyonensis]|uniref:histidine kinase n=1 Tax=Falsiroseomonas tokyonensis TaxID=430521 RepID=A0ABV7BXQ3_9PROT|nr:type II toxin-antitoxin system ParD family antitoxin [Falsiroseomonas tokyonensis]MBU8539186.1 type II toxin-antitoxin system ParD family antitoxin [Falsiroseomonas tokyonensis]